MLKPDPMRYSRAVPTRLSGPEWIEPDLSENGMAEPPDTLAFYHGEELPADLALDLKLHEILENALRATSASGAVIALASGDEMVCRATAGGKAPSTGVFLNTRSGLSGLCIQTGEMQRCEDALTDSRVNAEACRLLDIRSIVVLPILEGAKLWGIIEIFSPGPYAFSDEDVQALQAFGRRVSHTVREAVDGGSWMTVTDTWSAKPEAASVLPEPVLSEPAVPKIVESRPAASEPVVTRVRSSRGRDYRTTALTVAVIALAVLLGWMVGRVGWSMAGKRAPAQNPIKAEETLGSVTVNPQNAPSAVVVDVPAVVRPSSPKPAVPPTAQVSKPKTTSDSPDGLVVYEQGKVVFRTAPKSASPGSAPVQKALEKEGEAGDESDTDASSTNSYLVERVAPKYPEQAREEHIQGPVIMNALVGTDGAVRELKVISGDPRLAKAATDAVRQWRFQPHRRNGRPVEFETRITVNFTLS
jgi:TonB family protein